MSIHKVTFTVTDVADHQYKVSCSAVTDEQDVGGAMPLEVALSITLANLKLLQDGYATHDCGCPACGLVRMQIAGARALVESLVSGAGGEYKGTLQ